MEPYAYKPALLATVARKLLKNILERLNLWMSVFTQTLVDPHLEIQDASSGSATETETKDSLMTRRDSITCQSTRLDLVPLLLSEPPSHCHIQNDGDKYRKEEIPEEMFWCSPKKRYQDELELIVREKDHTPLHYHLSNNSEEFKLCEDSSTVLSGSRDTSPPPLTMWHKRPVLDCIDKFQTHDLDVLCGVSLLVIDTSEAENSDQDTHTGPRVVISPPDDDWENTAYNNQIGPQYLTCLVVPPFYQFASRLIKYEEWTTIHHPPTGIVSHDQTAPTPHRASTGPLVFSPTAFQKYLQDTKNDRFNYCYVVTALQRHQLKVAAYTASLRACLFRMPYDTPGFLENIEPQFRWIDPAEILIESFRHTPQSVTIYTSDRPCSVPHIVIHESLPNDPYVVWSNSTDLQNYCFLTTSPPNPSLWDKTNYQIADNYLTEASASLYDSAAPITPQYFSSTIEEDFDMLFGEDTFMVPQYTAQQSSDTMFPSKSKFFIPDDEEEDGLPPLDDWYITIANRCMPPERAEAVVAAAMSCY